MVSDNELRQILKDSKTIAVIGLSPVAARPSYGVAKYLQAQGYEIYGVRPASPPEILGRPCVESLAQLDADIDIVDVFRNPEAIAGLVDEIAEWLKSSKRAKKRNPKLLFLQEGVHDAQAEARAERLGLRVISNRCLLKEHVRLM